MSGVWGACCFGPRCPSVFRNHSSLGLPSIKADWQPTPSPHAWGFVNKAGRKHADRLLRPLASLKIALEPTAAARVPGTPSTHQKGQVAQPRALHHQQPRSVAGAAGSNWGVSPPRSTKHFQSKPSSQ